VSVTTKNFSSGGHGFGFNPSFAYHNSMLKYLKTWLEGLDDIIVGIKTIENESLTPASSKGEEAIYDLSGRKIMNGQWSVGQLPHGIFIMQNKKKLVK
jgi:hypothetical protein